MIEWEKCFQPGVWGASWVLKEAIIQKLLIFERKILTRIFGPTKENQIWRIKTNEELDKLIKHKNIINYIKDQRLSWFGHVQRMTDTRTVKKIFNPLNPELNPICYLLALLGACGRSPAEILGSNRTGGMDICLL